MENLWDIVNGTLTLSTTITTTTITSIGNIATWNKDNINLYCDNTIVYHIVTCHTIAEAWLQLQSIYGSTDIDTMMHLKDHMTTLNLHPTDTIANHVLTL